MVGAIKNDRKIKEKADSKLYELVVLTHVNMTTSYAW